MATYTAELRDIYDLDPDFDATCGLDKFPIFDESYRDGLVKKIKDHYWYREIGTETIDMFAFYLKRKMNEIMPYYNQLYESTKLEFDPISSHNIVIDGTSNSNTKGNQNRSSESTSSSDTNAKSRSVASNFPQVQLAGNADYATSATDTNSDTTTSGSGSGSDTTATENTAEGASRSAQTGYVGSPSDLLTAYRDTMLNIDMMVIQDLSSLFFMLWQSGDSVTKRNQMGDGFWW